MRFVVNKEGPKVLFPWNYIGKGTEGKVYKSGNFAYKCYHKYSYCDRLSLEEVRLLEGISTNRILLPRDTLYTCFGKFKGYSTRYIQNLGFIHYMGLPMNLIVRDFRLLNRDCESLGKRNIIIYDLMPKDERVKNYSFHDGLYFVDPGKYHMDFSLSEEDAILENKKSVEQFFYFRIISKYANEVVGHRLYDYDRLKQFSDIMMDYPGQLLDYISSDIRDENLGEYVKRKIL